MFAVQCSDWLPMILLLCVTKNAYHQYVFVNFELHCDDFLIIR